MKNNKNRAFIKCFMLIFYPIILSSDQLNIQVRFCKVKKYRNWLLRLNNIHLPIDWIL